MDFIVYFFFFIFSCVILPSVHSFACVSMAGLLNVCPSALYLRCVCARFIASLFSRPAEWCAEWLPCFNDTQAVDQSKWSEPSSIRIPLNICMIFSHWWFTTLGPGLRRSQPSIITKSFAIYTEANWFGNQHTHTHTWVNRCKFSRLSLNHCAIITCFSAVRGRAVLWLIPIERYAHVRNWPVASWFVCRFSQNSQNILHNPLLRNWRITQTIAYTHTHIDGQYKIAVRRTTTQTCMG